MNLISDNQVDRALAPFADTAPSHDPNAPQTPFPTSLRLSREIEDAIVDHVMQREDTLVRELGRVVQPEGSVPSPDATTWMGRREMWTLRYYNHVADRARQGTIYSVSNLTAAFSQRVTMQAVARANNFFFGTDDWFDAEPTNNDGDTALEDRIDRHLGFKAREAKLLRVGEQLNEFSFVRGEAVSKTTYTVDEQRFKKLGNVLVNPDGTIYPDAEGNPIFDDASWDVEMVPQDGGVVASPADVAMNGAPPVQTLAPTGQMVLKSDGVTPQPAARQYANGLWPVRTITREGAQSEIVYFKDFLCPLEAENVQKADIVLHLYAVPVMRLVEMFRREDLQAAGAKDLETMQKAVAMVRSMASGVNPQTAASMPRGDHGEKGNTAPMTSPNTEIIEAWLTYDVDGDGVLEEIMIAIDRRTRFPVFYDYTANLTVNAKRPFNVVRPRAVDGRWYGIGHMEYLEPEQEAIDLFLNRHNYRMSQAGRITWWNPHVTVEGRAQPRLALNFGKTYTLLEGYKGEDLAGCIELPDDSASLMDMLNFFMQFGQLKSGVINAGDQQASGLPTSNTATGINDVAKSGQEMFSQYLNCLLEGQEDTLEAFVLTTYKNMNRAEVFRYFSGDTAGLDHIEPDEVKNLKFIVRIRLTRQHTEKVLQTSAQATQLIKDFMSFPPQYQAQVAPFYRQSYTALGYSNGDKLFIPVPIPVGVPGDPNAQGAQGMSQASANSAAPAAAEPMQPTPPTPPQPII